MFCVLVFARDTNCLVAAVLNESILLIYFQKPHHEVLLIRVPPAPPRHNSGKASSFPSI